VELNVDGKGNVQFLTSISLFVRKNIRYMQSYIVTEENYYKVLCELLNHVFCNKTE